jgi:hypothetical protein
MIPGSDGDSGRSAVRDLGADATLRAGELAIGETASKPLSACAADIADDELWQRFGHQPVFPIVTLLEV